MARQCIFAFGGGGGQGNEFYGSGGTFSVQTSTIRSSSARSALRCNPLLTAVGWATLGAPAALGTITDIQVATLYARFYFRYATKALINYEEIASTQNFGGSTTKLLLGLNSSGNLAVYDKDISLVATGTTVLAANTWYRIELKSSNGTSGAYQVLIDGVSELSGTCNQLAANVGTITVGKKTDRNSNTVDYFYSEASVDDGAFPGATNIVQLVPRANGSTMQWTSGTGASDYTTVDDCPMDNTDYVMSPASTNKLALFAFDSCATAGITGTINAVLAVVGGYRENTSVTSSNKVRAKSGATNTETTAANLNTTDQARVILMLTDPNTGAAWTTTAIDALEAGAIEANAVSVRLAQVYIAVEYTPAAAGGVPNGLFAGSGAGA